MNKEHPYKVAVDLQRHLVADVFNPMTEPADKARLVHAWCELEERKRILAGKPLLKPIDPVIKQARVDVYTMPELGDSTPSDTESNGSVPTPIDSTRERAPEQTESHDHEP